MPKTIVDVGMHRGQDTAYYLKRGFNVIAIEANPSLVKEAKRKFSKAIANGRLTILNVGVAKEAGELDFYVNKLDDAWSSFVPEIGCRGGETATVRVPVRTLDEILQPFDPAYYIKIDIEGHDQLALDSFSRMAELPKYVSVENGHPNMLKRLVQLQYLHFKWINQAEVPLQRARIFSREGRPCLHRFTYGSSGPFGEDTPGKWLSLDEVQTQINRYWSKPNLDARRDGWFDLHARRTDFVSNT